MDRFLIKAAFGSKALTIGQRSVTLIREPMLIRGNAVRLRMLSIVSKNQNKLGICCIQRFVLNADIFAIGKV